MTVPQKLSMAAMAATVSAAIVAGNTGGNSGGGGSSGGGGGCDAEEMARTMTTMGEDGNDNGRGRRRLQGRRQ
jgi:hypothetical protein